MTRIAKYDGTYGRMDFLWKSYYRDPSLWCDNRRNKISPKFPDFKHKITSDSLWVNGWCNPFWVYEETRRRDAQSSNDDAMGICDRDIVDGIHQEEFIFMTLLKGCALRRDPDQVIRLHNDILSRGLLEKNPFIASMLISVYCKCGMLARAQQVLEDLPTRNVVTWSALIAGYAQQGLGHEALNCFEQMQREGIVPNTITFTCVLKACGTTGSIDKGARIHEEIASKGLMGKDSVLGTALVDMYAKCGQLVKAKRVLEDLPIQSIVSWSALMAGFAQQGQGQEALDCLDRVLSEGFSPNVVTYICILKACGSIGAMDKAQEIHDQIVNKGLLRDKVLATTLVDVYAKCGQLCKAKQVLKELSIRDVATWNALICGYVQQGQGNDALDCFDQMKSEGLSPNAVTFVSILKACCNADTLEKGKQIHGEILNMGVLKDRSVIGNALISMYSKCGSLMKAQQVFKDLVFQDVVSWNTLIYGYAKRGRFRQAICCFEQMLSEGVCANIVTFICIVQICSIQGAVNEGKQIHDKILSMGLWNRNIVLGTALVDMYAKFGMLSKAQQTLKGLPNRNVISWNALIAGYSQQGQGDEALNCLQWMQSEGISPNSTTLLCVLTACYRSGLLEGAQVIFKNMAGKYGVIPNVEHHSCMIAGFGRAGHFEEAMSLLKMLPSFDFLAIWLAVLSACTRWGNVKLGMFAFCQAIELDNTCSTAYVLMNDIFVASGMQKDADMVEAMRMTNVNPTKWTT